MRVAWLSLDEGDSDPTRFLTYFIAALQTIEENIGKGTLAVLQSPQPPPIEAMLTSLLNDITTISDSFILVLDDYHVIDSKAVDQALVFLVEHLPPRMHLVIASREDPALPLARLRARGQLTELRAADLRFTPTEAADFLNRVMGLNLSAEDISALEIPHRRLDCGTATGCTLHARAIRHRQFYPGLSPAAIVLCWTTWSKKFFSASLNMYATSYCKPQFSTVYAALCAMLSPSGKMAKKCWMPWNAATCSSFRLTISANGIAITTSSLRFSRRTCGRRSLSGYPRLHQRASAWYERNGLPSDAIRHALAAKDFERAAGLIELAWPAMALGCSGHSVAWLGEDAAGRTGPRPASAQRCVCPGLVEGW